MDAARTPIQRRALADFLRARRDRLTPAALGLPDGARRRAPGLRREEVAGLAGLSTTWYTWLEQGRDVSVSPHGLARIAAALRLDRAARDYLFEVAGRRDPAPEPDPDALPATLPACLAAIATPAYVLDRPWNARAWNDAARNLFAGWLDGPDPNLLRFVFLAPKPAACCPTGGIAPAACWPNSAPTAPPIWKTPRWPACSPNCAATAPISWPSGNCTASPAARAARAASRTRRRGCSATTRRRFRSPGGRTSSWWC